MSFYIIPDLQDVTNEGAVTTNALDVGGLTTPYVQYETDATPIANAPGLTQWNDKDDTLDVGANRVTYQLGQEISPLYKNQTGSTIPNGTPVMFAGTVGASGRIRIQPAIADGSIPAEYTVGLTTQDIPDGTDGHVTWFGKIRMVDTTGAPYGETWADGDLIYVSPTTPGYLTNVKPEAPNFQILVAAVVNSDYIKGEYQVRPTWNPKFSDLADVNGTPLTTTGQFAVWNQDNGYFDFDYNIEDYAKKITGTLTSGSVLFSNTLGEVDQDNASFYWDAVNKRLGIRTNTPTNPLEIGGATPGTIFSSIDTLGNGNFGGVNPSPFTGSARGLYVGGATNAIISLNGAKLWKIGSTSAGTLTWRNETDNVNAFELKNTGDMGISMGSSWSTVNARLSISETGGTNSQTNILALHNFATANIGNEGRIRMQLRDSAGMVDMARIDFGTSDITAGASNGFLRINTMRSGTLTEAIRILGNGNIGIGVTSPASKLSLGAGQIEVPLGVVGAPSYSFTGDLNTGMWSPTADTLAWSTGGSERMRIDSSGNVGIGTTAPTYIFQVESGRNNFSGFYSTETGSSVSMGINIGNTLSGTTKRNIASLGVVDGGATYATYLRNNYDGEMYFQTNGGVSRLALNSTRAYFYGKVGIGVEPSTGARTEISGFNDGTDGTKTLVSGLASTLATANLANYNQQIYTSWDPGAHTSTNLIRGTINQTIKQGTFNGTHTILANLQSNFAQAVAQDSGNIQGVAGFVSSTGADTGFSGTITNSVNFWATTPLTTGGTITNQYGVYIERQKTASVVVNGWGIYQADSNDSNYFGGKIILGSTVRLNGYTVATLPAGTQGDMAYVTDALTPTYHATATGGGTIVSPVFFDGTNWIIN